MIIDGFYTTNPGQWTITSDLYNPIFSVPIHYFLYLTCIMYAGKVYIYGSLIGNIAAGNHHARMQEFVIHKSCIDFKTLWFTHQVKCSQGSKTILLAIRKYQVQRQKHTTVSIPSHVLTTTNGKFDTRMYSAY